MATLYEIGLEYEDSAKQIRSRLRELRAALNSATSPDERWKIKRRIAELTPILTDCNQLAKFCKRYYEQGYFTNDGPFAREPRRGGIREAKRRARETFSGRYGKGADAVSTPGCDRMSFERDQLERLCAEVFDT